MSQAWTALARGDIWQMVSKKVLLKTDEDSAGGTDATNDLDTSLDTRAAKAIEHAVAEVRGAIEACGRYPVSLTAGTVQPEGVRHSLVLAAYWLCLPVPSLLAVLMNEGGAFSPMGKLYAEAVKWVEFLRTGGSFTMPSDPAGSDYATAIDDDKDSATYNPTVTGVRWGDGVADDSEFAAGETVNGEVVGWPYNSMNTN
jgi:hypothetical protein